MVSFPREQGGKSVDKADLSAAHEAGMPFAVIAGSEAGDYSAIISDVMERVLYGNNFKNSLINNTIFHLLNFEKYASFQQALHEAAVSNDFQVVLLSEEFNPVFAVEIRHKTTIN